MTNDNKKILMLIDGNALVYRSFYGLPPLTTKDGIQVNAVYGFVSSIFHAIEKFHPEYICVAFDVSKKTWRNKEYPDYKATRQKAPQELYDQLPLVKEIVNVLNIPQFGIKDYEADDVIGTISAETSKGCHPEEQSDEGSLANASPANELRDSSPSVQNDNKLKVIIVTGDMDTLQLVNDNINVYSVSRGIKRAEIFNSKKVYEKYGFDPKYLVDYKSLRGDPSDNIPGVSGIGEKTATKLVREFGTIENLYHALERHPELVSCHPEFVSGSQNQTMRFRTKFGMTDKIKNLLLKYKDQAFLSKKLATIVKNVPIDFQLAHCSVHDYNKTNAEKLFRRLEFKSLINRLPQSKPTHTQKSLF